MHCSCVNVSIVKVHIDEFCTCSLLLQLVREHVEYWLLSRISLITFSTIVKCSHIVNEKNLSSIFSIELKFP